MCGHALRLNLSLLLACMALVGATAAGGVMALSTDREQDMQVEADNAELDAIEGISIYRGNVIVIQGSMRITGHTLTVHFNDDGDMELAIMNGSPATYRQLPDGADEYDEARAQKMEYYPRQDSVILIERAWVKNPDGSTMTGNRIEYDTALSRVKVQGRAAPAKNGVAGEDAGGRVKIIIKKKKTPADRGSAPGAK